jgi:hypothetical protein
MADKWDLDNVTWFHIFLRLFETIVNMHLGISFWGVQIS